MRKKILIIFCLMVLAGCSNTKPKEPEERFTALAGREYLEKYGKTISLDEAVEIAKERNLDLKVKSLEREIASLDRKIAFGNFLPSINVMGGYTKLDDNIDLDVDTSSMANSIPPQVAQMGISLPTSMNSRFVDKSFYTFGVSAQIPVFVPSTWYLYSARKKGEKISGLVEEFAEKMLKLQVMGEYYYILALQSERAALENELKSARELENKVKISLKVEAVLPWEYEKAKAFVKMKEYALNENERDLKNAKMRFMRTLNLNPLEDIELEDEIIFPKEIPSMEDCIYSAVSGNEILKIAEAGKDVTNDMKKIAVTNFLPKIILGGGYINNSNEILSDPDFLYGNVTGVLSIFNGFKNINEYKKAVRREKIGELKLEKEFMTVVVETAKAYRNLEKARELQEIANLNFKGEKGHLHQKRAERKVDMIGDEEYFRAVSSYEAAFAMKKKADFQYAMALGSLKIAMGQDPFKEGK
ncbi:TolC family protein [Fusobacterium sp. SB021]|uniref:TolC family protein n=1 Tax=Fusobacterium sp. SB021 TaxID=2744227 RepID=UPI003CF9D6BB